MNYKEFRDRQIKINPKFKQEYFRQDLRFDVSHLITEARFYKNLSQEKLAKLVGTKQPSIARMESGKTLPSLSFLEKIAKALGTSLIAPSFGFMEKSNFNNVRLNIDHSKREEIIKSPYFIIRAVLTSSTGNSNSEINN